MERFLNPMLLFIVAKEHSSSEDRSKKMKFETCFVYGLMIEHVTALMVFGISCPYLSMMIVCDMIIKIVQWRLTISCYLNQMIIVNATDQSIKQLNYCVHNISRISFVNIWILVATTSSFILGFLIMV